MTRLVAEDQNSRFHGYGELCRAFWHETRASIADGLRSQFATSKFSGFGLRLQFATSRFCRVVCLRSQFVTSKTGSSSGRHRRRARAPAPHSTQFSRARLGDAHFGVGSENFAQSFADFAYRRVGPHRVHDVGHGVGRRDVAVCGRFAVPGQRLFSRLADAAGLLRSNGVRARALSLSD